MEKTNENIVQKNLEKNNEENKAKKIRLYLVFQYGD